MGQAGHFPGGVWSWTHVLELGGGQLQIFQSEKLEKSEVDVKSKMSFQKAKQFILKHDQNRTNFCQTLTHEIVDGSKHF